MHRVHRSSSRAFSLIELLVVVAVIAILIGLLLPALGAARQSARTLKCLTQMRSIEQAHVLYMNDHKEMFVDAGLSHGGGGSPSEIQAAWPVALEGYHGSRVITRSPLDRSPFWPVAEGGESVEASFAQVLELIKSGKPVPTKIARWTSYGLNSFTTRYATPSVKHPESGKWLGPWDRLALVERPVSTVHFLMMAQGMKGDPEGFATSDHVHPEDWHLFGLENTPLKAAAQMQLDAAGGPEASWESRANYSFLDGHAATLRFRDVYTEAYKNKFFPDFAQ